MSESVVRLIDHAVLQPGQTDEDVRAACAMCCELDVASVCVKPCHVALAAECLGGLPVAVSTVIVSLTAARRLRRRWPKRSVPAVRVPER